MRLPAFSESAASGDDTFALDYDAKTVRPSRTELGLRWDRHLDTANGSHQLTASAIWAHNLDTDRTATAGFSSLPGSSFDVAGAAASQDAMLLSVSREFAHQTGWVTSANLTGALGDNSTNLSAGFKFNLKF